MDPGFPTQGSVTIWHNWAFQVPALPLEGTTPLDPHVRWARFPGSYSTEGKLLRAGLRVDHKHLAGRDWLLKSS